MMQVQGIERACCVFDENKGRLYGFYVGCAQVDAVENELLHSQPVYQIPKPLIKLEIMPLTKNGKIDRKVLLEQAVRRKRHEHG